MTDQVDYPEPTWEELDQTPPAQPVVVPQFPDANASYGLANHVYTISISPKKPPMIVIRAQTGVEANLRIAELESAGVYVQIAGAQELLDNAATPTQYVQQQMGATPIAQQVHQAYPTPQYQAGPPVPSQGQPPFGGGAPQGQWGGTGGAVAARPAGWFAVKIPFAQREAGDQVKNYLKAQGLYQGNVKWEGATKTWLVSPAVKSYFDQWNPIPA